MKTTHQIILGNAKNLSSIPAGHIDLIVTSPPYPMIQMWDETFAGQNPAIEGAIKKGNGSLAFELMHQELDQVWNEVYRVLKPGGIACINVGDATRTINHSFQLYSNHARILNHCLSIGFVCLPNILWRKTTNAPNKFMGSGMLPAGAYVTLEHEFILILRKGGKRNFRRDEDKLNRQKSAFFWEERNLWFSDVWELKGTKQALSSNSSRQRSGAFPLELAYRLINMHSVKGDTVLDPFLGTGTTVLAAMASGRNSIGVEIDGSFKDIIAANINDSRQFLNHYLENRLNKHVEFVAEREKANKPLKYFNKHHGFPVMTSQETEITINRLQEIKQVSDTFFEVLYQEPPR